MAKGKSKVSKLKKTILGIAIALLLVFFIGYSVNTIYESPQYEDFCGERMEFKQSSTRAECEAENGRWNGQDSPKSVSSQLTCTKISEEGDNIRLDCVSGEGRESFGFCDFDYNCREDYDNAREPHARISFIVLMILGIVAIVVGGLLLNVEAVGAGIMGGGVLTLIYAAIRFWGSIPDYARLLVLGSALGVLIWLGYRKLKS